ncbi:MAG: efflux RND transporter periplasmic adaptor subunit, partial [Deltaproteobacteria bacterium]|nr:efflux RND transporter periplasmic adaptor subunit [Deltaproteobacteria bacterium]
MTRSKLLLAGGCLAGLIIVLVWMQGGFHSKVPGGTSTGPREASRTLKTERAAKFRTAGEVTVSGAVTARETARVASQIMGSVLELKVDAGDKVKKGDVLLRIDTRELEEKETQAKAALESAQADFVKAEGDFRRYEILFQRESISRKDYDHARAQYEVAQAARERAQANLDQARTMVSYGTVRAPFDGVIGERHVNPGDLATPGRTLLTVYVPGSVELVAAVGEQYAPYVKEGSHVTVSIPSLGLTQETAIREVVPQRDEKTRTITVKASLVGAQGLGPGLYGTL